MIRRFAVFLAASVMVSLIASPLFGIIVNAQPTSYSDKSANCVQTMKDEIGSYALGLDNSRAKSLAENSKELKSVLGGHVSNFHSIFETWSVDSACHVTLMDVNVAFTILNQQGSALQLLVVRLDPRLTQVLDIAMQPITYLSSIVPNPVWSGYTIMGNSAHTNPVYEANGWWNVPRILSCPTSNHCDVAFWTGLTNDDAGHNGIVQDGTDSYRDCSSGTCIDQYRAIYAFNPNSAVYCLTVNQGDRIYSDAASEASRGGIWYLYDIYIYDSTIGRTCSISQQNFSQMGTPYFGQFITERPVRGVSRQPLPAFSTTTISSARVYYSGATNLIYTPYSNGWYELNIMRNGCGDNISNSNVDSSGSFTETWLTSCGT